MKKIFSALTFFAFIVSCSEDTNYICQETEDGVFFNVPDFEFEGDTRVAVSVDASGAHFSWTSGDTIGVFPQNGYPTAFPLSSGDASSSAIFDGADWALRPNASYLAYYPFSYANSDKTKLPISYIGQTQNGNGSTAHLGKFDYLSSALTGVDASGNASFNMNHIGCLYRIVATMPSSKTFNKLSISTTGTFPVLSTFDLSNNSSITNVLSKESIELSLSNIGTTSQNENITLYVMMPYGDYSTDTWSINIQSDHITYSAEISGIKMIKGKAYSSAVSFSDPFSASGTRGGHKYVDLGLPSGTLWANCNLGAEYPEEYGGYYAWGETKAYGEEDTSNTQNYNYSGSYTKTYFDRCTYKYAGKDSYMTDIYTKYFIVNTQSESYDLEELSADDDAAKVNWSGDWRMPTKIEMAELKNNCYWEWTDNYNGTGIKGSIVYKIKSSEDKGKYNNTSSSNTYNTTDVHIFLPAAKLRYMYNIVGRYETGDYYSSSIEEGGEDAIGLHIYSTGVKIDQSIIRFWGHSIRPVMSKPTTYTINGVEYPIPEAVDLGLPSGTKWAKINLGSKEKNDCGLFFAWGEILPSISKKWEEYKYYNENNEIVKYYDNFVNLDNEDDPSCVYTNDFFTTPTRQDWQELFDNCFFCLDEDYYNVDDYCYSKGCYVFKSLQKEDKGKFGKMTGNYTTDSNHIYLPFFIRNDHCMFISSTSGYGSKYYLMSWIGDNFKMVIDEEKIFLANVRPIKK